MELLKNMDYIIQGEEKELSELRTLIGNIVTDVDLDVTDMFNWYSEDNEGTIEIYCNTWALGALEEAIDIISSGIENEDSEYTIRELNLLNKLLNILIKANKEVSYIELR